MTVDEKHPQHIIADEGKVFKRIEDGLLFGNEIWLGYTYYIGGVKLEEPHLEVAEDFEEITIDQDTHEYNVQETAL